MSRFVNPHQMYPNTPMQGNMAMQNIPNQGMAMQQPNVQMVPIQTPYGVQMQPMYILPNGQMVPVTPPQSPPQGMPFQSNTMYPNMNMQPNNRFQQVSIPQGFPASLPQEQEMSNRFQQPQFQTQETQETQTMKSSKVFNVTPVRDAMSEFNNIIKINTYLEEVKDNHINNLEKSVVVDCFGSAIESIIETGNTDSSKLITMQKYIINNTFYKTAKSKELRSLIETDIKSIYKSLKAIFPSINNKYDLNMFNQFDVILTDFINDYLYINTSKEVSIDSFMSDFNDLLKFIRNNSEDLEDNLIDALNAYLAKMNDNFKLLEECGEHSYIPEENTFVYVDKFLIEIGLHNLPSTFAKLDVNPINVFVNSLGKYVFDNAITDSFTLVTIDKEVVAFRQDVSGNIWLKKLGQ